MTGVASSIARLMRLQHRIHAVNRGLTLHPSLKIPAVMNYSGYCTAARAILSMLAGRAPPRRRPGRKT
jgi:hypothetical protein